MKINVYQVDVFVNKLFEGNPAAIFLLQEWLSEQTVEALAAENNLSETAFFVPDGDGLHCVGLRQQSK